jgi:hypothetical protein
VVIVVIVVIKAVVVVACIIIIPHTLFRKLVHETELLLEKAW